jgi:hypothetical protein
MIDALPRVFFPRSGSESSVAYPLPSIRLASPAECQHFISYPSEPNHPWSKKNTRKRLLFYIIFSERYTSCGLLSLLHTIEVLYQVPAKSDIHDEE